MRDYAQFNPGRGGLDPPVQRRASDFEMHDLEVSGRHKTRFFRVTRGALAEADHAWTRQPSQPPNDNVAFILRFARERPQNLRHNVLTRWDK